MNEAAINTFFERRALAGGSIPGADRSIEAMGTRMLQKARSNANTKIAAGTKQIGAVRKRSGVLHDSLKKIVRVDPRTGQVEVGVGSTARYAEWLEYGSPGHEIKAKNHYFKRGVGAAAGPWLISAKNHPDPLVGRDGKPRAFKKVKHPGTQAKYFIRKAVHDVAFRGL